VRQQAHFLFPGEYPPFHGFTWPGIVGDQFLKNPAFQVLRSGN